MRPGALRGGTRRLLVAAACALLPGLVSATQAGAGEAESWLVATDLWGNTQYQTLTLVREGTTLAGTLDGESLTGRVRGATLDFVVLDAEGRASSYSARLASGGLAGTAELPDTQDNALRVRHPFTARRLPARPAGPPRRHDFVPTSFANEFSPHRPPVLTVWPGDTVHTTTIDSGGVDAQGVTRALYGNPQTGPFFVGTAEPGDTLVVRIRRLRLNRDYADSLDTIVPRVLGSRLAASATGLGVPVRWKLDRARGLASPQVDGGPLAGLTVPVAPMLGGLAVAPGFGYAPASTGDTGAHGGNMDCNALVEGSTVYLPVYQPGALLYLGDAHAAQGDGETSGWALETSMDVEFSVEVIKGRAIHMPRIESPTEVLVLGQAGSLDEAVRASTTGLLQWLQQDYGLNLSQGGVLLGSAVRYRIANLAGRSVGVSASLDKSVLATLRPAQR